MRNHPTRPKHLASWTHLSDVPLAAADDWAAEEEEAEGPPGDGGAPDGTARLRLARRLTCSLPRCTMVMLRFGFDSNYQLVGTDDTGNRFVYITRVNVQLYLCRILCSRCNNMLSKIPSTIPAYGT